MALPATRTAKRAMVIVCLLMSRLYLNLSKRNDNVEHAAEASGAHATESEYTRVMRRGLLTHAFLTRSLLTRSLAALALVATAAACDDAGPTTPTDTTTETTPVTETFSGTLGPNSAVTFPFTASAAGTATGSVVTVAPDSTMPLGLAMGTWAGTACQVVISNDNAIPFSQVVGTVGGPGALCLRVYDVGRISATVTFTVKVIHP